MSQPTLSEYVSALQLLMSDLDTDSRAFVLTEAFPALMVICRGPDAVEVASRLTNATHLAKLANGIVDGSSGLGSLAAVKTANHLADIRRDLTVALKKLHIREPQI